MPTKRAGSRSFANISTISMPPSTCAVFSSTNRESNFPAAGARIGPCAWRQEARARRTMDFFFPRRPCSAIRGHLLTARTATRWFWELRPVLAFSSDRAACPVLA